MKIELPTCANTQFKVQIQLEILSMDRGMKYSSGLFSIRIFQSVFRTWGWDGV